VLFRALPFRIFMRMILPMEEEGLRGRILRMMQGQKYRPMNKSEFTRNLELSSDERAQLRSVLKGLEREGLIVEGKKSRYELLAATRRETELSGVIRFTPRGHAWFFPDRADDLNLATGIDLNVHQRLHIPRRETGTAMDGDRVQVEFYQPRPTAWRRNLRPSNDPEEEQEGRGRVVRVLERRSGRVIGTFAQKGKFSWVETDDPALAGRVELTGDTTAQPGQLVVVEIENWEKPQSSPRGRVLEVLGWPGDSGVDIRAIIHRHGLATSFPEDVLAQTRAIPGEVEEEEKVRREDWRDRLVITIDPADAKDHDDAIWVGRQGKGWLLAVHIADVSHYVKPHTPIDKEAVERGNSTYLVDRVLPMLPPELSNGICSLKPHCDRLTKCALISVGPDGKIGRAKFSDALIHSQAKLSYEQAQAILDGKPLDVTLPDGVADMVREAWSMASLLRKRRFENGALDLEMQEIRVKLDEQGKAVAVVPVIHTASHQLIEECMLAANQVVAEILKVRNKPSIYRIHEDPDFGKLADYTETARAHGYEPGDLTNRAHIQKLLDSAKGRPDEHIIKLGLLKSLKRAAYAAEPLGHYGLAKGDYCHFTSPIRRYADLIVHRALQPFLTNPPKRCDPVESQTKLIDISRHVSDTERKSADAESESKQLKMMEYLAGCAALKNPPIFKGMITDVRPIGLMVEAPDIGARGMIKREGMPPGEWRFEGAQMRFISRDGRQFQLGALIEMKVARVDLIQRFVDFRIVGDAPTGGGFSMPSGALQKRVKKERKTTSARKFSPSKRKESAPVSKKNLKHKRRR
jgi:ribonuclease R